MNQPSSKFQVHRPAPIRIPFGLLPEDATGSLRSWPTAPKNAYSAPAVWCNSAPAVWCSIPDIKISGGSAFQKYRPPPLQVNRNETPPLMEDWPSAPKAVTKPKKFWKEQPRVLQELDINTLPPAPSQTFRCIQPGI